MSPLVGLIMGSDSDWPTVEPAAEVLQEFAIPFEVGVVSAHRTPERMLDYARTAHTRGLKCIIAFPQQRCCCIGTKEINWTGYGLRQIGNKQAL